MALVELVERLGGLGDVTAEGAILFGQCLDPRMRVERLASSGGGLLRDAFGIDAAESVRLVLQDRAPFSQALLLHDLLVTTRVPKLAARVGTEDLLIEHQQLGPQRGASGVQQPFARL